MPRFAGKVVHCVQDAIVSEPQRDWDMASLAEIGHAAERHLAACSSTTPASRRCTTSA